MSEQSALQNWIDEWTALRDHTRAMLARLEALTRDAPSPNDAADVRRLFDFRDAASLDGPASEGAIFDAAQRAAKSFADLALAAGRAARALLTTAEGALPALAREGIGAISGTDLPPNSWFHYGETGERKLIGARLRDLPADHVLRGLMPEGECFLAAGTIPAVILGPAVTSEGDLGLGYAHRPRRWYAAHEIPGYTRAAEARRRAEAENQARVSAALAARQRADEEARDRADPQLRMKRMEKELMELRQKGAAAGA